MSPHELARDAAEIRSREKRIAALDASITYLKGWLAERRAKRAQAADAARRRAATIAEDIEIDTTPRMADVIRGYTRIL